MAVSDLISGTATNSGGGPIEFYESTPVSILGGISGTRSPYYSGFDGNVALGVFVVGQSGGAGASAITFNNIRTSGSPLLVTAGSGGVALPNLACKSLLVTNHSGNAAILLGSTTDPPFGSGTSQGGYLLTGGNSVSMDVANASTVKVAAVTSGQSLSYLVVLS